MGELFDPTLINPNIIYFGLIIGLWLGITAIYIPGTGVPEAITLVVLGGSLFALTQMPTNWFALVLIIVGVVAFLLAPFLNPRWSIFAPIGLIPQGVGSLFLFNGFQVSLLLVGTILVVALLYHQFFLVPIMRRQQEARDKPEDTLIGKQGRVVSVLNPVGTVQIEGELWTARSKVEIEPDTSVIVTGQEGLELQVEKAKRD